ncbi:hypothetical protein K503DRAFT_742598 [Rhizopogon vinicolor AM-OR11-026]|uniref:Uncharacterized protein n=1 Tax=Rhizopogon vinicolor AM-OR11-026 TaxID=1314800 RepID=A0A1B7MY36_9AGAM|nr:hypothetical protein K503DRAFT_742598 [Rhizopogon vinicolor AM-OR11-026]
MESNNGQRETLASSCAPSSSMQNAVESSRKRVAIDLGNLAIPLLTNETAGHAPFAHGQGGDRAAAYAPSFPEPAAVQDANYLSPTDTTEPPKVKPTTASFIQGGRYERVLGVPELPKKYVAPPGVPDFSERIDGRTWQSHVHPEGTLLFYEACKRIVTEVDIRQSDNAKKIERASNALRLLAKGKNINIPETAELVLGISDDDDTYGYYFVDHDSKSLFWAESYKPDIFEDVPAKEKSHIKYAYEMQYWIHCDLFPNQRFVQTDSVDRLNGIIMHAYAETVTAEASLAPYSADDLNALMALIGPLKDSVGKAHEHSICIIARLMQTFTHAQFINFCGQPAARLDVDKPLYHQREDRHGWTTLALPLLNIALFGSLQSHKKSIERVWVDNTLVVTRWKNFIDGLNTEWSSFTVFSTVMLAVDVSFLAVPGIDSNSVQSQSASLIMAYLSTLCAMGSLVVSLLLGSQIQVQNRENVDDGGTLFLGMSNSLLGLNGLALIYSLPFSLLIWAMVFFAAGLSVIIFHSTDKVALGVVGVVWASIMLLIGWPLFAINNIHISAWIKSLFDWARTTTYDFVMGRTRRNARPAGAVELGVR